MKSTAPAGCGLMILGIIGLLLFAIPTSFSYGTRATQLYSSATMWVTLLVAVGIGLLLLAVEDVRSEIEKQLSPATPTPTIWEYCDLMKGQMRDGQTGKQRQLFRLLYYSQANTQEYPISSQAEALLKLSQDGWELVSVYTISHSTSVLETHWVFKRQRRKRKQQHQTRDLSSVISSLVAKVDSNDLKQDAQHYYKQGMRLTKAKQFIAAADEFAKVLCLAPDGTKWNRAAQKRLSELYQRQVIE